MPTSSKELQCIASHKQLSCSFKFGWPLVRAGITDLKPLHRVNIDGGISNRNVISIVIQNHYVFILISPFLIPIKEHILTFSLAISDAVPFIEFHQLQARARVSSSVKKQQIAFVTSGPFLCGRWYFILHMFARTAVRWFVRSNCRRRRRRRQSVFNWKLTQSFVHHMVDWKLFVVIYAFVAAACIRFVSSFVIYMNELLIGWQRVEWGAELFDRLWFNNRWTATNTNICNILIKLNKNRNMWSVRLRLHD